MASPEREAQLDEHQVTPLELYFDLVFVFAITQVTTFLTHDPTWGGVGRAMLVLAAVWWTWNGYSWLTSTADVDEGGVRLVMLAATAVMLGLALSVPHAFTSDALLFGVAFLLIRLLHLLLYVIVGRGDPHLLRALARVAPTELTGASLLVAAAFVPSHWRVLVWVFALAIDYFGPLVVDLRGWRIAPAHFAERYGLVVLIALGESIVAIGVGARFSLTASALVAAALGSLVVSAFWWLYFDVAAILARARLIEARGLAQIRMALDAYSYLHFPIVAGVVLFAFGVETTILHIGTTLQAVPAVALCGGAALYLLGQIAYLARTTGRVFRRRSYAAILLLCLIPAAMAIPALAALGLVAAICALLVAIEAVSRRESRAHIRGGELAPRTDS